MTAVYLWNRWKHLLRFDPIRLTPEKLMVFARAFTAKGSPLPFVAALIDGTLQKNARPVKNQHLLYNGWKRIHCLKYHILLSPDGLVIHVYGPVDGRRHDETGFKESGLQDLLDKHFWTPEREPLFIYGDSGYTVGPHIIAPYKGPALSQEQQHFNTQMSRICEPVEWLFKEVTQKFTYLDFARTQKVLLSPCGVYYLVSLLLCNAHTILNYPQIPQYFLCRPPTLQEYFRGGPIGDSELDAWCLQSLWDEGLDEDSEDPDAMEDVE
ncbi:hypothetical protein M422DRAFT_183116 [Sphaerobolus stellatus SS14]|uniref:DDE Tnp4 domain-containing protein n=1 Tax=Sphaerobolus stellatus (strain SS14) TaxID=990650 RepID=A0A0C9UFG2_SPHS4|nr:hypothetical protein M422DRAFT_183116 [Sphaerobolus stellatus SS14]